jgi:hypothetical protein
MAAPSPRRIHNPLSTAWTIMIAIVVTAFAVPAAI